MREIALLKCDQVLQTRLNYAQIGDRIFDSVRSVLGVVDGLSEELNGRSTAVEAATTGAAVPRVSIMMRK